MSYLLTEKAKVAESQVVKIWQHQLLDGTEMTAEDGEPIRVIYPGRINDDRGADFRDAVIAVGREVRKGDIEVHVNSSAWRSHGHCYDPAYNRVILHVVMWHDTEEATSLQDGKGVPVLVLGKYIKSPVGQLNQAYSPASSGMPCLRVVEHMPVRAIAEFLEAAGQERFRAKAGRFEADLAQTEASQCLYQGVMGALGYSRNKLPCLELAHRVPLQILESMTQSDIADEECLARQQALLLGTAGLLPSQSHNRHQTSKLGDEWVEKLERLWVFFHQAEVMSCDDWCLFKVRPNNSPVRRIVAMSYLVLRYKREGILKGMVSMVERAPLSKGHLWLEEGLMVTANGYGASNFAWGLPSRMSFLNLLGRRRAADIAVNVLLPFIVAWSKLNSWPELERKAFDLYRGYPELAWNTVERHMRNQLGLSSGLVNSAVQQQGLIRIYNSLCTQGRCDCCPFGGSGNVLTGQVTYGIVNGK